MSTSKQTSGSTHYDLRDDNHDVAVDISSPSRQTAHLRDENTGKEVKFEVSDATGDVISFHNLTYHVKLKGKKKGILKDVSGMFGPGLNAILGPTGSGKTSLLDILAGRKDPRGLSGRVLVNGKAQPRKFKYLTGYVVQEDVVMGALTVKENLMYSAALRLPRSVGRKEREERVDHVLGGLGLTPISESRCGTEFLRGISGGEKKRVNIGIELLHRPSLLFLDEPTSGLDANIANSVIEMLGKLSASGDCPTIIFSIHQPRYSIFKQFTTLFLLSQGECVYHGPQDVSLKYFSNIGYQCEMHNNPADFFMDVINGDVEVMEDEVQRHEERSQSSSMDPIVITDADKDGAKYNPSLAPIYRESNQYAEIKRRLEEISSECVAEENLGDLEVYEMKEEGGYATSCVFQLVILCKRNIINLLRNPMTSIGQVIIMVIFSLIVGSIYWQLELNMAGLQNRVGAFFFLVMNLVFGNLSAVELFIQERPIFIHQNAGGFYRTSSYFLAKVFCDILPMRALPVIVFSAITYWMLGFKRDAFHFLFYLLNMLLTSLAASGISFFASASVGVFALANLIVALVYVFMMVFSGLLVNLKSIVTWLRWIKYLSIFRYSMAALSVNELKGLEFCDPISNETMEGSPHPPINMSVSNVTTLIYTSLPVLERCTPGEAYLSDQGIAYETSWDLWHNEVALGAITCLFMLLAYIQLRLINKWK